MKANITEIVLPKLADGNPEGVTVRHLNIVETADPGTVILDQDLGTDDPPVVVNLLQGRECKISLVDSDAAGNKSEARITVITPSDVTPPSEPGEIQLNVKGEVDLPIA